MANIKSINIVSSVNRVPATVIKKRSALEVGDVFKNANGKRLYMHTGVRTAPPSGSAPTTIVVNGQTINVPSTVRSLGRTANGQDIVGFQSIVVQGTVKTGEDGSSVSFDGTQDVIVVGKAELALKLFG